MKKITFAFIVSTIFYWQSNAQLNEGFDVAGLPTGWSETILSGSGNDWAFGATQNQNNSVNPRTGAGMAYYYEGSYNGEINRLETPSQDLTSFTTPVLTFYYTQVDWGGDQDELSIWYKDSAAGTWTMISEYTSSISSWTEVNIILPNPSADYYIGFQGFSGYGRGITIDDVSIAEAPSCLTPGNLSVFATSTTEANLMWLPTGSETDFTYEYGTTGFAQGTGTTGMVTANSVSISGLTAGTDYDFYVQANCGVDGDSAFAGPFTWTQPGEGESCGTAYVATLETDCGTATPISLDFTGAPSNIATSCDSFNNYGLWVTATTDATGGLTINASAAVDMAIYDACGATDIECYGGGVNPSVDVVLSPNTQYYLYFWQEGTSSTAMVDVCISSFTPAPAPNCAESPTPADLATGVSIAASGVASLSWSAPSSGPVPTDYELFFGDMSGSLVSLGTTSGDLFIDIVNLDFSTTYYWQIVPINGVTPASGCPEWSFTTEAAPAAPANDECSGAIALTVNSDFACAVVTSATTISATASPQPDDATGTPNNDVWFSFVATGTAHRVQLNNVVNGPGDATVSTDMAMSVFNDAAGCSMVAANEVGESDPNTLDLTGLIASNTYYVRVYSFGTDPQNNNFDICVGTPPPPPVNDLCSGSVTLPIDGTVVNGTTESASGAGGATSCDGSIGNDVWYVLTGDSGDITVEVIAANEGAQIGIYESSDGTCSGFTEGTCIASVDDLGALTTSVTFSSVMGTTYYVNLGAWISSGNDFPFTITATSSALSTSDFDFDASFTYYPNPVENTLTLNAQNTIETIMVYNMLGQDVLRSTPNTVDSHIDMSGLQTGTYFVKVTIANTTRTIRVIKQ